LNTGHRRSILNSMSTLTLELRPREQQTTFNLRRWQEALADPELQKIPGRVETDRHGRIIMSPPPAPRHGEFQIQIGHLLRQLMPGGKTMSECPVSTADGVRAIDVAWASPECRRELGNRACFIHAPEICVEILSPSNSEEEIREKTALYFDAGAQEVWTCGAFGQMSFFASGGKPLKRSALCPSFPERVEEQ
jgi:Uma2 family endonuclease